MTKTTGLSIEKYNGTCMGDLNFILEIWKNMENIEQHDLLDIVIGNPEAGAK